jgi:phospholipid/cholesterol/gamma-HCH transport system substrate-binding protein
MDKTKALTWTELRVGSVVIVSLVVLAATILYIGSGGGSPFSSRYRVKALMSDVNGLKTGAPVRLGGVEVGSVTGVEFAPAGGAGMVEVTMRLDRRVKGRVTTQSQATLGSLGLLGEKAVDITTSTSGGAVEDGGFVAAAAEDPFKGLLTDASDSTTHLKRILSRMDAGEGLVGKALRDEELYERLVDVSVRLQSVMTKLESQKGPLGRLMNDEELSRQLSSSAKGIERVVSRVEGGQGALGALSADEALARDLSGAVSGFREVVERMQKGEGSAGRLMKDDTLFRQLESTSARLDGIASRLERGEGSAGRLLQDPELYENMNATLKDVRALVSDVRRDPRKYLRVRVSLF